MVACSWVGTARIRPTNEVDPATESGATRLYRQADLAGVVLLVIGCLGVLVWAWTFVRGQFDIGSEDSFYSVGDEASLSNRLDLLTNHFPLLLLAGLVAGLGIALRAHASTSAVSDGRTTHGLFGGAFPWVLIGSIVVLGGLLGIAMLLDGGDDDDDDFDFGLSGSDEDELGGPPDLDLEDRFDQLDPTTTTFVPPEPTYTLEVHDDGCGVIRSGEIGDDLTWVVKDQDGFQVLGRNAAGETQYRYFQPGTYTVVLEAWGGDFYVEVSNEVTITC